MTMHILTTDTNRCLTLSMVGETGVDSILDFVDPDNREAWEHDQDIDIWRCTQAEYDYWVAEAVNVLLDDAVQRNTRDMSSYEQSLLDYSKRLQGTYVPARVE